MYNFFLPSLKKNKFKKIVKRYNLNNTEKNWIIYVKVDYRKDKDRFFNIQNYKSVKDTNIELDKLTILVGENASGKSNILEFFYQNCLGFFILDNCIDEMSKNFANHALGTIKKYRSEKEKIIIEAIGINELKLTFTIEEEKEIFRFNTPFSNTKSLPIEETLCIGSNLPKKTNPITQIKEYFRTQITKQFEKNTKAFSFFNIYLNMSNLLNTNVEEEIDKKLMNLLEIGFNLRNEQEDIYEVLSFLPKIVNTINDVLFHTIELKKRQNNTEDKRITIYLNLDIETDKKGKLKANKFKLLVRDESENKVFPPHMKSYGVNNIISIITITEFLKFLIKNYSTKNYTKLDYLVTIDEPELYLHPKIQKNLIHYIYNTSKEFNELHFLISTHSPYMIHNSTIKSTYLTEYDMEKGTKLKKLIDVVKEDQDKYNLLTPIEDALGLSFNEFLHPIIFVEGKEEFDIFKRISRIYECTNSIHSLNGKNKFAPIAILLDKFKDKNNNFYIFLDADFNFNADFKFVENSHTLINTLSNNIFFIGKEIYNYEEYNLEDKRECLEDFILFNIFQDKNYTILEEITKPILTKYFKNEYESVYRNVNSFNSFIEKLRAIIMTNKKSGTELVKEDFIKDEFIQMKAKDIKLCIEGEIKNAIKNKLLNEKDKFNIFQEKILNILKTNYVMNL
jgi:predicted ATP-binding protein involved in virulence